MRMFSEMPVYNSNNIIYQACPSPYCPLDWYLVALFYMATVTIQNVSCRTILGQSEVETILRHRPFCLQ